MTATAITETVTIASSTSSESSKSQEAEVKSVSDSHSDSSSPSPSKGESSSSEEEEEMCNLQACLEWRSDGKYCQQHTCSIYLCQNLRSVGTRGFHHFCGEHKCDSVTCSQLKFEHDSSYDYSYCQDCLCRFLTDGGKVCRNPHLASSGYCTVHVNAQLDSIEKSLKLQQQSLQQQLQEEQQEDRERQHQCTDTALRRCLGSRVNGDCLLLATEPSLYCDSCRCDVDGCYRPVYSSRSDHLCSRHICQVNECEYETSNGSRYCIEHR